MPSLKRRLAPHIERLALIPLLPAAIRIYANLLRAFGAVPAFKAKPSDPVKRVLIIGLSKHIGDTVMILPMIDRLHRANPQTEIEVAVATQVTSLLRDIPYVARVHGVDVDLFKFPFIGHYRVVRNIFLYALANLRNQDYDACLLPRWGRDPYLSSYLAYLTNAPIRCGQHPDEEIGVRDYFPGAARLMSLAVRGGHGLADAVRQLRLLPAAGLTPNLDLNEEAAKPIEALLCLARTVNREKLCQRLGIDPEQPYCVIAPGATHPFRLWPVARYAQVARALFERYSLRFLVIGGPSDVAMAAQIEDLAQGAATSIAGKTSLVETISMLSRAALFLGNDSGPAHIAAGLGVPAIVISVSARTIQQEWQSSPLRVRPVGPRYSILQPEFPAPPCTGPCTSLTAHCILGISAESVFSEADNLLSNCFSPNATPSLKNRS